MAEESSVKHVPSEGAMAEAKRNPGGWVYEVRGSYGPNDFVPPYAVVGAWKVNEFGDIVEDFMPNPNYDESKCTGGN